MDAAFFSFFFLKKKGFKADLPLNKEMDKNGSRGKGSERRCFYVAMGQLCLASFEFYPDPWSPWVGRGHTRGLGEVLLSASLFSRLPFYLFFPSPFVLFSKVPFSPWRISDGLPLVKDCCVDVRPHTNYITLSHTPHHTYFTHINSNPACLSWCVISKKSK